MRVLPKPLERADLTARAADEENRINSAHSDLEERLQRLKSNMEF
jgi:hypothetical protein